MVGGEGIFEHFDGNDNTLGYFLHYNYSLCIYDLYKYLMYIIYLVSFNVAGSGYFIKSRTGHHDRMSWYICQNHICIFSDQWHGSVSMDTQYQLEGPNNWNPMDV